MVTAKSGLEHVKCEYRLHFVVAVWGAAHLNVFLNATLPTLLAPGNLPSLKNVAHYKFLIYTRANEKTILLGAHSFQWLSEVMPVEIYIIPEIVKDNHATMSDCHRDAIRRINSDDAIAVFPPADCIFSNGSIGRLESIVESGKSVIYISGIRLDRDAVMLRLSEWSSADGAIAIPPRQLAALGLSNLHRNSRLSFWNEYEGSLQPANLYWTVPGGLIAHCYHLHPLLVGSQKKDIQFTGTIDDDFVLRACPNHAGHYVVTDSDDMLMFELSGPERFIDGICPKGSVEGVVAWAEIGTNMLHRKLILHAIRFRLSTWEKWVLPFEVAALHIVNRLCEVHQMSLLKLYACGYSSIADKRIRANTNQAILKFAKTLLKSSWKWMLAVSYRLRTRLRNSYYLLRDRVSSVRLRLRGSYYLLRDRVSSVRARLRLRLRLRGSYCWLRGKLLNLARRVFARIQKDFNYSDYYVSISEKCMKAQDFLGAITALTIARQYLPKEVGIISGCITARIQAGDYVGALTDANQALDLEPNEAYLVIQRAIINRSLEKWSDALTDYNTAISILPNRPDLYAERDLVLAHLN